MRAAVMISRPRAKEVAGDMGCGYKVLSGIEFCGHGFCRTPNCGHKCAISDSGHWQGGRRRSSCGQRRGRRCPTRARRSQFKELKMNLDRSWMYKRFENGFLTNSFVEGVETFVEYAINQAGWNDGDRIKCPCKLEKCQNRRFLDVEMVKYHLVKHGFVSCAYGYLVIVECTACPSCTSGRISGLSPNASTPLLKVVDISWDPIIKVLLVV